MLTFIKFQILLASILSYIKKEAQKYDLQKSVAFGWTRALLCSGLQEQKVKIEKHEGEKSLDRYDLTDVEWYKNLLPFYSWT